MTMTPQWLLRLAAAAKANRRLAREVVPPFGGWTSEEWRNLDHDLQNVPYLWERRHPRQWAVSVEEGHADCASVAAWVVALAFVERCPAFLCARYTPRLPGWGHVSVTVSALDDDGERRWVSVDPFVRYVPQEAPDACSYVVSAADLMESHRPALQLPAAAAAVRDMVRA